VRLPFPSPGSTSLSVAATRRILRGAAVRMNTALLELRRRAARPFSHARQLRPRDVGNDRRLPHPRAEAAVGARDDALAADEPSGRAPANQSTAS
jgi:hypothetical protein